MKIHFTRHAEQKFDVLGRHGFLVKREQVVDVILSPEGVDLSKEPLIINQKKIDKTHYLRVVYKKEGNIIKVITFYPARVQKYAKRITFTKS